MSHLHAIFDSKSRVQRYLMQTVLFFIDRFVDLCQTDSMIEQVAESISLSISQVE